MELDAKIPEGPMDQKWTNYKNHVKLVSPANKRKLEMRFENLVADETKGKQGQSYKV